MTKNNEQITLPLHLKSKEDLNERIIKEKGNTKCIFYNDDECRNGDRTRDCVNCARVEYRSLYKLNWDNQTILHKEIYQLKKENDLYKNSHKTEQDRRRAFEQTLEEIREIITEAMDAKGLINLDAILNKINEVIDEN